MKSPAFEKFWEVMLQFSQPNPLEKWVPLPRTFWNALKKTHNPQEKWSRNFCSTCLVPWGAASPRTTINLSEEGATHSPCHHLHPCRASRIKTACPNFTNNLLLLYFGWSQGWLPRWIGTCLTYIKCYIIILLFFVWLDQIIHWQVLSLY